MEEGADDRTPHKLFQDFHDEIANYLNFCWEEFEEEEDYDYTYKRDHSQKQEALLIYEDDYLLYLLDLLQLLLNQLIFKWFEIDYWVDCFQKDHEATRYHKQATYRPLADDHISQICDDLEHIEQIPYQIKNDSDAEE